MRRVRRVEDRIAELLDRGAPSSRVQLAMKLSRSTGDQLSPAPTRRQRAEVRQLLDLGIGVERQIAERVEVAVAARHRQVEIDRAHCPGCGRGRVVRSQSSRRRLLSRWRVLAPTRTVALASPAGSLNKGPLAVRIEVARGAGRARAVATRQRCRSEGRLRVRLRTRSALPVSDQRQLAFVAVERARRHARCRCACRGRAGRR